MERFTEDDKLQAEVNKLHAEARNLSRPYFSQPTSWVALGALVVSLAGNWLQHSDAAVSEKLAKIEEKEHQIKRDQLAEQERQIQASIDSKQKLIDELVTQHSVFQSKLEDIKIEISKSNLTREALATAIANANSAIVQTGRSDTETTQLLSKPLSSSRDLNTAHAFEVKGYEALINGKFEEALSAFASAEAAANGYHFSYEIARLLRQRKSNLQNPLVQREVLAAVAANYLAYASPDQRKRLKELSK